MIDFYNKPTPSQMENGKKIQKEANNKKRLMLETQSKDTTRKSDPNFLNGV